MLVSNEFGVIRLRKTAYLNALKKYRAAIMQHINLHTETAEAQRELAQVDSSINAIVNYSIDDYVSVPLGSKILNHLQATDKEKTPV